MQAVDQLVGDVRLLGTEVPCDAADLALTVRVQERRAVPEKRSEDISELVRILDLDPVPIELGLASCELAEIDRERIGHLERDVLGQKKHDVVHTSSLAPASFRPTCACGFVEAGCVPSRRHHCACGRVVADVVPMLRRDEGLDRCADMAEPDYLAYPRTPGGTDGDGLAVRSEERRVGKECRSRWSPYH